MRTKFKRPVVVVFRILCVVAAFLILKSLIPFSPQERALRLYRSNLKDSPYPDSFKMRIFYLIRGKYEYHIESIGKNSWYAYRIFIHWSDRTPLDRYLIHDDKAVPVSDSALVEVFKLDLPGSVSDADQLHINEKFLKLQDLHPFALKIISQTGDIPNYATAPLKPELAATIKPPVVLVRPDGNKTHILYTHHRLTGAVRRYEFTFNRLGQLIDVRYTEIGAGIGGKHYLM